MTNRKVILAMALIVAGSLVVAAIGGAFAGGIVGYVVARRSLALRLPWGLYQQERQRLPVPFLRPLPEIKRELVILPLGAQVIWVEEESPAEEAGIEVGDIITGVDDQEIDEEHRLRDLVLEHEPGETITLTLSRGGESREIQVTLGEATDEEGRTIPYLGVHYWSIRRRFFRPERFDLSRLQHPRLHPLFRRLPRRIRTRLPSVYPTSKG